MQNHAEIWFKALTKDHEASLKKQQDDVNSLRRQLDHVISFTKWATGSQSGTALLYCKRLVCTTFRTDSLIVVYAACLRKPCSHICYPQGLPQQLIFLNLALSSASSPFAKIPPLNFEISLSLCLQDHFPDALSDESKLQSSHHPTEFSSLSVSLWILGLKLGPRWVRRCLDYSMRAKLLLHNSWWSTFLVPSYLWSLSNHTNTWVMIPEWLKQCICFQPN